MKPIKVYRFKAGCKRATTTWIDPRNVRREQEIAAIRGEQVLTLAELAKTGSLFWEGKLSPEDVALVSAEAEKQLGF